MVSTLSPFSGGIFTVFLSFQNWHLGIKIGYNKGHVLTASYVSYRMRLVWKGQTMIHGVSDEEEQECPILPPRLCWLYRHFWEKWPLWRAFDTWKIFCVTVTTISTEVVWAGRTQSGGWFSMYQDQGMAQKPCHKLLPGAPLLPSMNS